MTNIINIYYYFEEQIVFEPTICSYFLSNIGKMRGKGQKKMHHIKYIIWKEVRK